MLDVANQRAAHDIVTAAKDPCFPERVLVWSIAAEIERAAKSESLAPHCSIPKSKNRLQE